jgi:hypothetical protein
MKLCDRCRVSGCLLTYGGKACREARKQECPDVVFTRADKIREMDDEELAVVIMCPHDGDEDSCKGSPDTQTCIKCCLEWLREPTEVL